MLVRTILNSVTNYKSFVLGKVRTELTPTGQQIVVEVRPRKNSRGLCPACGRRCPTYDPAQTPRHWEFPPLWNIPVFFAYYLRRVSCPKHGIRTARVPWGDGKCTLTNEYRQFLANWARRMSWSEVSDCFETTFGKVYRSVQWIVDWGLKHRTLDGVESLGVDEVQIHKGQH
jgi:transposase